MDPKMKSELFYTDAYKDVEKRIRTFLNKHPNFLGVNTVQSPRATAERRKTSSFATFKSNRSSTM